MKEKLKKLGSNVAAALNWVGNHLGTLLTIFSAAAAFLFLRERARRQEAETTLALDEKQDAVNQATQDVENAQQEADSSLTDYRYLKSQYNFDGSLKPEVLDVRKEARSKSLAPKRAKGKRKAELRSGTKRLRPRTK